MNTYQDSVSNLYLPLLPSEGTNVVAISCRWRPKSFLLAATTSSWYHRNLNIIKYLCAHVARSVHDENKVSLIFLKLITHMRFDPGTGWVLSLLQQRHNNVFVQSARIMALYFVWETHLTQLRRSLWGLTCWASSAAQTNMLS